MANNVSRRSTRTTPLPSTPVHSEDNTATLPHTYSTGETKSMEEKIDMLLSSSLEVKGELKSVTDKLDQLNLSYTSTVDDIASMRAELEREKRKSTCLESELALVREDLTQLELYSRRHNLLIDNVPETEKENVRSIVLNLINNELGIVLTDKELDKVHRVGNFRRGFHRSIIVRFPRHLDRDAVFMARTKLKGRASPIWINEDLPTQVKERRGAIRSVVNFAKSRGIEAKAQFDHCLVDGKRYSYNTLQQLPESLSLSSAKTLKVNDKEIAFASRFSPLSNFYPSEIIVNGTSYSCVEQAYQHIKAVTENKEEIADTIMKTTDPARMKKLGDKVKVAKDSPWIKHREPTMRTALMAKFNSHPVLREALLATTGFDLVEATPDLFWGAGCSITSPLLKTASYKGANTLGKLLMARRDAST